MVITRLRKYEAEYYECVKKGKDMSRYYRGKGISLIHESVIRERCDILYEIYIAKERFLKMYHGYNYTKLERDQKKAFFEYNVAASKNMDECVLKRLMKKERETYKKLYRCLEEI